MKKRRLGVSANTPGVAKVNKTLADGTQRTYWYAWRGGPLLKDEDGRPLQPAEPRFFVAYTDAHRNKTAKPDGTLYNLVALFRASTEFTGKAKKTQRSYESYLKLIENEHGSIPINRLNDTRSRGIFKEWRDQMSATPRKADYAWTVLARVLSVAKDRGKIKVNVCERGGKLYDASRAERIWTAADITAFCAVASEDLQAALLLALWTGQRQGDLLRLTWKAYDGTHIKLRQSKTKQRVTIPVAGPLKTALDAAKANRPAATSILTNSRGLPWTEDGFRTSWRKAFAKTELVDLHFHDLRGTAVTRLALAGCTVTEIASITGHSLKDAQDILDAHYLGGRVELAEAAISKLSALYGT